MNSLIGKQRISLRVITGMTLGFLLILVAGGCNQARDRAMEDTVTVFPSTTAVLHRITPTPLGTLTPSGMQAPSDTPTPSNTPTASVTASATVTPTRTPTLHPMNILAARETSYPGSSITIEETLEPGANYYRYIAWYESDGLRIYGLLTLPFGDMPATGWPAIVFNH